MLEQSIFVVQLTIVIVNGIELIGTIETIAIVIEATAAGSVEY